MSINPATGLEFGTLPPIGDPERDKWEAWAIEFADDMLVLHENIEKALGALVMKLNYSDTGRELADHVEQVWITRLLRS